MRYQAALAFFDLVLVSGLGRGKQVDGAIDVALEELRELLAGLIAVVGLDRVADVGLVLQQPRDGGLQIGEVVHEGDDRQPCPGDVVLPELSHLVLEGMTGLGMDLGEADGVAVLRGDRLIDDSE